MTAFPLARTAAVTLATGALLLGSLTVAGSAVAAAPTGEPGTFTTPPASATAVLNMPKVTVPHGRKIG